MRNGGRHVERFANPLPARAARFGREDGISNIAFDGVGQCRRVLVAYHQARTLFQQFGNAPGLRADHRNTVRHGFDERDRNALVQVVSQIDAGKHDHARTALSIHGQDLAVGPLAEKLHGIGQAEALDLGLEIR